MCTLDRFDLERSFLFPSQNFASKGRIGQGTRYAPWFSDARYSIDHIYDRSNLVKFDVIVFDDEIDRSIGMLFTDVKSFLLFWNEWRKRKRKKQTRIVR